MELDAASKHIRNLTGHFPHHGYTRALYLANGDILLSGPEAFDPKRIGEARVQCWLYVLDQSGTKPARLLGTKCSEGPAVSEDSSGSPKMAALGGVPGSCTTLPPSCFHARRPAPAESRGSRGPKRVPGPGNWAGASLPGEWE